MTAEQGHVQVAEERLRAADGTYASIRVQAGIGFAILALADAVAELARVVAAGGRSS